MLVYLFALCMRVVRVLDTLALSITIIQDVGNIKRYSSGYILYNDCFAN